MSAEQALDSLVEEYGDSLAVISYNYLPAFPYTPPEIHDARWDFYSMGMEPSIMVDGTDSVYAQGNYYTVFKSYLEAARTVVPLFNMEITATADSGFGSVALRFVTADTLPGNNLIGCLAICQDSTRNIFNNFDFNYICKKFYSFPLNLVYPDTLDTTVTFTHNLLVNKLRAVAFVQDLDTKEILQAITTKF
jgi:hypothetical protein